MLYLSPMAGNIRVHGPSALNRSRAAFFSTSPALRSASEENLQGYFYHSLQNLPLPHFNMVAQFTWS
jgi:hypothetical protein